MNRLYPLEKNDTINVSAVTSGIDMQCPTCKEPNPETNQFCGKCGTRLDAAAIAVGEQVEKILALRFKDRALVEHEVTDSVVNRLTTFLKVAAWVFAPSIFILGIAISIMAFLGFRTYSDATGAIKSAAATAVSEVNSKASNAEGQITAAAKRAQEKLDSYAQSPALVQSVERLEKLNKEANTRVDAVLRAATEDQHKLSELAAARQSNPDITLGQLNPQIVTPTFMRTTRDLLTITDTPSIDVTRRWTIGSHGDEVKVIQRRLQERDCYTGEISGTFDKVTEQAVLAYKRAKASKQAVGSLFVVPNDGANDGAVDWLLFSELDSAIVWATCPKQ